MNLSLLRTRLAEILRGAALVRYERDLRQQTAELNDLFLLLCFMEAAGMPNPATLYLLEIYPYLLEHFHQWHRRMGIERSPSMVYRAADDDQFGDVNGAGAVNARGRADVDGRENTKARRRMDAFLFRVFVFSWLHFKRVDVHRMISLLDRQVVFFGGKGGVGKTTCSSAFALAASRRGQRVLLVSTDPAHSTSDIFERTIGPDEREIEPRLWAIEIDAGRESTRYVAEVKRDIERMFAPAVIRQAYRQIDLAAASPGLAEVALLDRMIDLIVEREARYDLIVFDTAPTGHTVQLLRMPEVMDTWIRALVKHRRALLEIDRGSERPENEPASGAADPVLAALERRQQRLKLLRDRVFDRGSTSFVLVTIPERLAIEETARAAELLAATGMDVGALVVNRMLPDELEGEFYRARKAQEALYLTEIARRFTRVRRTDVRQLPRDVYGLASLTLISDQLLG